MSGNNLTLQGTPTYNSSGKFGSSLNGGNGYTTTSPITGFPFTIQQWVKGASSGNIEVAGGRAGVGWVGKAADNSALAHFGSGPGGGGPGQDVTLSTTVSIADGAWHFLELVVTSSGGKFFVDGNLVASSTSAPVFSSTGEYFGARAFFSTPASATAGFNFTGEVDELAVFNTALHSASYSVPTAPYTGAEAGLVALYHFDGNDTDSQGSGVATAVTLSGPTSGTVGAASTPFTVAANGTITGTVVVTPSDASGGGTFSPTSVSISSGSPTGTFTYTPASAGAKSISVTNNGSLSNPAAITYTAASSTGAIDTSKLLFSPGNWNVSSGSAKTINDGAYVKGTFSGASCTLGFDISTTSAPLPKIVYRVDGNGPWITVDLAATIALTMPTETAAWTEHTFVLQVAQTSEANSRWSPQNTAVVLNAMTLASGGAQLPAPAGKAQKWLFIGDSIFNGVNALNLSTGDATTRGRAQLAYPYLVAEAMGVEMGLVAFGGQGWVTTGGGSVPPVPTTYASIYSGVARSFAGLDAIIINHGQNDASASTTTQVTAVLNGLIAATDRRCKIVVLRPLSGLQAANIQAGIAACSAPSRITYIDTTGWFTSANSVDGVHPVGWEHSLSITPKAVAALRPVLMPLPGVRTARTVSLTLTSDGTTPRANLAGLKWALSDVEGVVTDSGIGATTDANGVMTLQVFSTLSVGATAYRLWVSDTNGSVSQSPAAKAFSGPVVLS